MAKSEIQELSEFICDHMATKEDLADLATKADLESLQKKLTDRIDALDSKVSGINRRLDTEAIQRTDLKLARRVHELEEEAFGEGSSKHPKHVPL